MNRRQRAGQTAISPWERDGIRQDSLQTSLNRYYERIIVKKQGRDLME